MFKHKLRKLIRVVTLSVTPFIAFSVICFSLSQAQTFAQSAPATASKPVRFIAIGDAGTGGAEQKKVGARLAEVCRVRGCDFAVYLGDNIYESGVRGVYDSQFESKFEDAYKGVRFPFFAALGNHDNSFAGGEGAQNAVGDFEVEYTFRRDRTSHKWQMPARYYTVRHGDVQIFALDTNAVFTEGVGTLDPGSLKQAAWLRNSLAASNARWKLTFGHHPYLSNGEHGNAGTYDRVPTFGVNLKTFMENTFCGKADVFLCGHDHDLQWLKPVAACGGTQFIVSGAGGKRRSIQDTNRNSANFQRGDTYGFFWIEIVGDSLRGVVYDSDGTVLHDQTITKSLP